MRDAEEETITLGVLVHTDASDGLTIRGEKRDEIVPIRLDAIGEFKKRGPDAIFCLNGHVVGCNPVVDHVHDMLPLDFCKPIL
eukprot:1908355-Ditylum_brightwellii.AAC.1